MNAKHLAGHIERTVTGPMWHGPSLGQLLHDITPADAAARPIAGAHSIWELVLHVAAWADVARRRLHGLVPSLPPDEDFPPVPEPTAEAWAALLARLESSHRTLAADVRALDDEVLRAMVPGAEPPHPVAIMLHGVVEHGTYHAGQIALLKRALGGT